MKRLMISSQPGFEDWREHARRCLQEGLRPDQVFWQDAHSDSVDLFALPAISAPARGDSPTVPKEFLELARLAACHASPDRFALLYRVLWRLTRQNKNLLRLSTDDDILKLNGYIKAVRRDAYKIKAFLRFRALPADHGEHYAAWYEPEHFSLELSLPFFQTRFRNMVWSILTPYLAAHWDGTDMTLCKNPDPSFVPAADGIETYWLKYYASTFNPARPKKAAMLNQMPKKYWKNMPETVLIEGLLRTSESRARKMIEDAKNG